MITISDPLPHPLRLQIEPLKSLNQRNRLHRIFATFHSLLSNVAGARADDTRQVLGVYLVCVISASESAHYIYVHSHTGQYIV
jgi:hypothetical protein